jgi:apolipoprotein N-acyltransferase
VGPSLVSGLGLLVLILFLSLFIGCLGWLFRRCLNHPTLLVAYPLAWAGLEVWRAYGQMSFPWNNLGYSLGDHPWLIQTASLFGVYGLSAGMVAINLALWQAWRNPIRRLRWNLFALGLFSVGGLFGVWSLSQENPLKGTMDIALVQPSVPQTKKWDEHYFQEVMSKTFQVMDGSKEVSPPLINTDLTILPETAIPDFLRSRPDISSAFQQRSDAWKTRILVGALNFETVDQPWSPYQFFNNAYLFSPGQDRQQYSKLRLVPFSEKLPFDDIFPLINYVNLGEGDFNSGLSPSLWGDSLKFAPTICYEVIYPSLVRQAKAAGADFIVNITNDGWFGRSQAPYQHANIARLRTVEMGLPMARTANTGISVFFDEKGRDLGRTQLFEETLLRRNLLIRSQATLYFKLGADWDFFFGTIFGQLLAWALVSPTRRLFKFMGRRLRPKGLGIRGSKP